MLPLTFIMKTSNFSVKNGPVYKIKGDDSQYSRMVFVIHYAKAYVNCSLGVKTRLKMF